MRLLFAAFVALAAVALPAATFTVTNLNDSGAGSLRQAMLDADAASGSDVIEFQFGLTGTITLASTLPVVSTSIIIHNSSPADIEVSGAGSFRVLHCSDGANLSVRGLTISDGFQTVGGAVLVQAPTGAAELQMLNCILRDSTAQGGGALYAIGSGTSISSVSLDSCTFTGNTASQVGGAILLDAGPFDFTCTNCTFSGNSATVDGGAVWFGDSGGAACEILNCTFTANTAAAGGALFRSSGTVNLAGCIVAGNLGPAGSPDGSGAFNSLDGNLVGDATGMTITAQGGDQFGSSAAPIDPLLLALADYGGPTPTCRIDNASPAVDAGESTITPGEDQRGYSRVDQADCGAYELQPPQLSVEQTAGTIPANSNVFLTGSATPAVGRVETFTIRNLAPAGEKNLQISGIYNGGTSNCSFAVTTTPAATVVPNGTTTLEVTITPATAGLYWCTLFIDNTDPNTWSYSVTLIGVADSPAVVTGGSDSGDDEGCSTGQGGGPVWLTLLCVLAVAALRRRRTTDV